MPNQLHHRRVSPDVWALFLFIALAALLGGPLSVPVRAQEEPAEDTQPTLAEEGEALAEELHTLHRRVATLQGRKASAEGRQSEVLLRRTADAKLEYLETISELVENVVAQKAEGHDASALRAEVEAALRDLPEALADHLDSATLALDRLRVARDELPAKDQVAAQHDIARMSTWLYRLLRAYAEAADQLEALGIDATAVRADALVRASATAEDLAGHLDLVADTRERAWSQLQGDPGDEDAKDAIIGLDLRRSNLAHALTGVVDIIKSLGGETAAYEALVMTSTGKYTVGVLSEGVLAELLDEWWSETREWARVNTPVIVFRLLVFVLILIVARVIAAIVKWMLLRRFKASGDGKATLLQQMVEAITVRTIMLVGLLIGLSQLGLELAPLLAGLGIMGFIVGFALQDTLSNFAAGVMILVYSPFDVGDMIEAAGVTGSVNRMSMVSTTILTIDNQTLIVPNSKIWGNVIRNVTRQEVRRIDLKFRVAYTEDLERMEGIFTEILAAHPNTLQDPAPRVCLHELGEYAMEIIVRPWVATIDYWPTYWDLMRSIKLRLDAEGISVPLPGREVHVRRDTTESAATGGA